MHSKLHARVFSVGAVALLALSALPAGAQVAPLDNRTDAMQAAARLLEVQFADGSFPWIVGQAGKYQNVQGITAIGLLDAFTIGLDPTYLGDDTNGAKGNRNWLASYMDANPTARLSGPNVYFLAKYALLGLSLDDLDLARDAVARSVTYYGSGTALAQAIINARVSQGHTNLGLWDVALWVRAAQDVGDGTLANEIAAVLASQTIVDPFATGNNWYELGLAGLLFGLGEADYLGHRSKIEQASTALIATQCANGSFPTTWQGDVYCDDVQSTAYAVLGLTHALHLLPEAQAGCDWLRGAQAANGGWDLGGYEIAEVDGEAAMALVACVLPLHNGVTSYADAAVALLPVG